jgi:hypothetical protein
LAEDCCGWNRKIWADALEFAISELPARLDGKKVLEIGAGKYSSISPIFLAKGAELLCSCYRQPPWEVASRQLKFVLDKYALVDINDINDRYDIII